MVNCLEVDEPPDNDAFYNNYFGINRSATFEEDNDMNEAELEGVYEGTVELDYEDDDSCTSESCPRFVQSLHSGQCPSDRS
jgi:hypothetical protein